ncbi:hypothetical protein CQ018_16020 [Arthrobacter sp. MYb227]|uniref:DUF2273 domain-containing protein n=1 Tax=Arthrobacter sp. MYb227 TaxID=1848601 RepID=UPI000CFD7B08|nr:DUF2273 domain-containing protein [Arthrobacter sp. MYb227]PQZ89052.1 hypothetical protein CQ018_16020 [Arthrobacter sp. MYb227]
MKTTLIGTLIGAILAWAALSYGFGGFLLMAVFMAIGAFAGKMANSRVDFRALRDVLTGRRSSS